MKRTIGSALIIASLFVTTGTSFAFTPPKAPTPPPPPPTKTCIVGGVVFTNVPVNVTCPAPAPKPPVAPTPPPFPTFPPFPKI